jgi:hypothetical protein
MAKLSHKKQAADWTASKINDADLKKVKDFSCSPRGSSSPATRSSPARHRASKLCFSLSLSEVYPFLPMNFFVGFSFVYGVQLDQLTPNSILHIACFILSAKLLLASTLIGDYGSTSSISAAMSPSKKFMTLGVPSYLCAQNLNT